MPLTVAVSATIGNGIMLKFVRECDGFSAGLVNLLAIFNGGALRDPEMEAPLRSWLARAMATGAFQKLKSLRRDAHEQNDACLFHSPGMCLSSRAICEPEP